LNEKLLNYFHSGGRTVREKTSLVALMDLEDDLHNVEKQVNRQLTWLETLLLLIQSGNLLLQLGPLNSKLVTEKRLIQVSVGGTVLTFWIADKKNLSYKRCGSNADEMQS